MEATGRPVSTKTPDTQDKRPETPDTKHVQWEDEQPMESNSDDGNHMKPAWLSAPEDGTNPETNGETPDTFQTQGPEEQGTGSSRVPSKSGHKSEAPEEATPDASQGEAHVTAYETQENVPTNWERMHACVPSLLRTADASPDGVTISSNPEEDMWYKYERAA